MDQQDCGRYVRYTQDQVDLLEKVYLECPKPSSVKRQQLVRDSPILSNIDPKQIKVWFQNRRCREKQRKEASDLQSVNWNLTAMNKLLMEENERLQKQVSNLVYENGSMKHKLHSTTTGTEIESMGMSSTPQQQPVSGYQLHTRDASNTAGLLSIAEKTLAEFLPKATGTAVNWVQIIGMKPGPDSIGSVAVSSNCSGIAARACDLVSLAPSKVAELLKDSLSWYRDCRRFDVLSVLPTPKGGTIELIHMEMYAPTTLSSARDFWMLRYSTTLEDGSIVICERSLTQATGGPWRPATSAFVRGEILPSGYLVSSCDDGGSILHIVQHIDLDASSVPEVVRSIYESSKLLAQRSTLRAIRHVREVTDEIVGEVQLKGGRQPTVLRAFRQKLCRGFNDAVNGFADDGWSLLGNIVDDVTIAINTSSNGYPGSEYNIGSLFPNSTGVLCAKATMLLQNVNPALLVRFLREHRSEWADYSVDAYSAASLRNIPYAIPSMSFSGRPSRQVIIPLAKASEYDESLEVVRIEGQSQGDMASSHEMHLLQLCTGIDEDAVDACAELIFTSTDEPFADNSPLLPSGFRVIPLDPKSDANGLNRTLDLTSFLEIGSSSKHMIGKSSEGCNSRSILVIAFQFTFENPYLGNVAAMARQYVHNIIGSVQRVAMAIAPSRSSDDALLTEAPEALKQACLIFRSYRIHAGVDLFRVGSGLGDATLKQLWTLSDAIMCCSVKTDNASPVFTFANQAGLELLETSFGALQNVTLEKVLDEAGHANLFAVFSKIMQLGIACLPAGRCTSSMGRPVSYDAAIAWKVVSENSAINHCLAFKFVNWSFV
ncbi:unnamed protein product [Rhodiola kirilowii]